ncbi:MAG: FAD-binding protein [Saprospiraceae bacterium]
MPTPPQLTKTSLREWTNRHLNFTQKIEGLYDMANGVYDSRLAAYNAMTDAVQNFIRQAIADNTTVRALGAGWSLSRVAATPGRMLNTKALNLIFNITPGSVAPAYAGAPDHLLLAQCGVSIQELNRFLEQKKQCLPTSGASNGQTIAGALSTGTHGAAFDVGAIPEFVVGLHLITGPDRHIWLERASYPVIADALAQRLNAELIRDDALFNAALVSFGSFGFIHGVLLETEPLYLLESHRLRLPFDARMQQLMGSLDFDRAVGLPQGTGRPFHFQVTLNPYDLDDGVYVNVKYKLPYPDEPRGFWDDFGPGDDAPAIIGKLGDVLPALVPFTVNQLIGSQYKPFSAKLAPPGDTFSNTTTYGKVLSAAIGIALPDVLPVTEMLLQLNRTEGPFNGVFAHRYVKRSSATLGFTAFAPVTCVLELDGVESKRNQRFCQKVWAALDALQIPYTFHWGKIGEITPARLRVAYGQNVDAWLRARKALLDPGAAVVFAHPLLTEWGLDDVEISGHIA